MTDTECDLYSWEDHAMYTREETRSLQVGALKIGALLFSNESGLLGMTDQAASILRQWRTGL